MNFCRCLGKTIYVLIPLCMLSGGCAPEGGPEQAADSSADLFNRNCGACHGAEGRGPSLDTLRALSPDELRAGIRNHPTAGQIPERLPANQINDLIEYIEE